MHYGFKKNCVNMNKSEKRANAKKVAKQGNVGERPDAVAKIYGEKQRS